MDSSTFNILSICSGAGGLDIGVSMAVKNARTVCYIENEAYACEVLASRMEDKALDSAPIWTDLRTFDGAPWNRIVDCIIGGIPCQPHSVAGKRMGEADSRNLWPDTKRIIQEVSPFCVFIENVPGMLSSGGAETIHEELDRMDFRIEAGLFGAEEVGGTCESARLFWIAMAKASRSIGVQNFSIRRDRGKSCGPSNNVDGRIPLFPPGRNAEKLDIEPAIHRMDARMASRLDNYKNRLCLTGNGVIPAQATFAFITLASCISE